jgi:hypothetical protein
MLTLIPSVQRLTPRTYIDSIVVKLDAPFFVDDEVDLKRMDLLKRSGCCYRQPQNLLILSMEKLKESARMTKSSRRDPHGRRQLTRD